MYYHTFDILEIPANEIVEEKIYIMYKQRADKILIIFCDTIFHLKNSSYY